MDENQGASQLHGHGPTYQVNGDMLYMVTASLLTSRVPTICKGGKWAHTTHANTTLKCSWMGPSESTTKMTHAYAHTCSIHLALVTWVINPQ